MYCIEQYFGSDDGWSMVSPFVDQATACRRLRLHRACRGHQFIYRIRRKYSEQGLNLHDLPFAFV